MIQNTAFTLRSGLQFWGTLPEGFHLAEDAEAPYRYVWANPETWTLVTYCEGDVISETAENETEYGDLLRKCQEFYGPAFNPTNGPVRS